MTSSQIAARLERLPISWVHYRLLLIHGFGWLFDAMDVGIVTFALVPLAKDWQLSTWQTGWIGSAGMIGMFCGAVASGIIADYIGRKRVFQTTLLVFAIASLFCAFAWNYTSLLVFRLFVGFGLGGELPVVASLLSEFIPSAKRGKFIVLLESFWAYGWVLAAFVGYVIVPKNGWRVCGIATDYCVRASALDAVRSGFKVTILTDLVRPVDSNASPQVMMELEAAGVEMDDSKSWLQT